MRLQGTTPWTNAEDEILKAAVMKYGLQQWGRTFAYYYFCSSFKMFTFMGSKIDLKSEWSPDLLK